MTDKKGLLLVVSGPSGAGKGTVCKRLVEKRDDVFLSVSATTRAPREGEINGKHYHFISEADFEERIRTGGMLEHAVFCGNYYGTPKQAVDEMLAAGKKRYLRNRGTGRDEGPQPLPGGRLYLCAAAVNAGASQTADGAWNGSARGRGGAACTAAWEFTHIQKYNYILLNDDVEKAVCRLEAIIDAEHCRTERNINFIEEVCHS